MSVESQPGSVYLREARVDEFETILRLITRAFISCPITNWCGSLFQPATAPSREQLCNEPIWRLPKHIELIYYLRYALLVSTHLAGGRITAVVRRYHDGSERIVAVASWLPPGSSTGTIRNVLKSKWHRALFGTWRRPGGWGFSGLQKLHLEVIPAMARLRRGACEAFGVDSRKCWTLANVATDPDEAGKGFCRMLVDHGLAEIVRGAPVCLETVNAKARSTYARFGFETIGKITLGSRRATELGLVPMSDESNEPLPGFQCWAMVKNSSS